MGGQGRGTGVGKTRKVWGGRVEVGRKGGGQGHRAHQQLLQGAGTIIMSAGDGHGDDHVGDNQGRRGSTAKRLGEGTGDVFAVQ